MSSEETIIIPRNNTYLIGHEQEEQVFLNAWKNNTMHNSWLISGVEGIGKATFAYRFARFLLSADGLSKDRYSSLDVLQDNQVVRLINNNSHPDFKVIERDFTDTDKKKILKAIKDGDALSQDELQGLKKSAYIRVDDVRTIHEFLAKKSGGDNWRVVLIDSVDDMNLAAANALLKILEEPPHKTIILLISHNPNRLLPTIRSRCAKINFSPLENNQVASLLRRYRTDLSETDVKKLAEISSGSIGKAIKYSDNNALQLYNQLSEIVSAREKFSVSMLQDFCNQATTDDDKYSLAKELILKFINEKIKSCDNPEHLIQSWDEAISVFAEVSSLNMDKTQALIKIIVNLSKRI